MITRILCMAGAPSSLVQLAPVLAALRRQAGVEPIVVEAGQPSREATSARLRAELGMPPADVELGVTPGPHSGRAAEIMCRLEPVLEALRPRLVLTVGDASSTLAAALTAARMHIRVAHVGAGLRCADRSLPEEVNRVLTDAVSDVLFVAEESGRRNLLHEGIDADRIHFVGSVTTATLQALRAHWQRSSILDRLGLESGRPYALLALRRPDDADSSEMLDSVLGGLHEVSRRLPVLFVVPPRTRPRLADRCEMRWIGNGSGELAPSQGIACLDRLGYLDFVALMSRARLVFTDSAGIQEETTCLGVPCLTLRPSTECPVTVEHGTNRLVGWDPERLVVAAGAVLDRRATPAGRPPLWDGRAAGRIVNILLRQERRRALATRSLATRAPARPRWVTPRIRPDSAGVEPNAAGLAPNAAGVAPDRAQGWMIPWRMA